jgi:polysaccharide deacetylase family protein (PEP-CTERM system associated)
MFAFSVDVEDWYQSSHDLNAPVSERCVYNTQIVLDFLEDHDVKGTFFVQGMVAKSFPAIVREIHSRGHEVQSHGYSHRPVNSMSPEMFRYELETTSKCIEDITGTEVTGFRAPDFSIDEKSFWAFDVMYECGIRYDSSIFPMKTNRYGIDGFRLGYSSIKTKSGIIEEIPVSVLELGSGLRIPVGGGGYFRLFPLWFLKWALKRLRAEGLPFVVYCHPYEFNPEEWKDIIKHIPLTRKLHQGLGRKGLDKKIKSILMEGEFGTMANLLKRVRKAGDQVCA